MSIFGNNCRECVLWVDEICLEKKFWKLSNEFVAIQAYNSVSLHRIFQNSLEEGLLVFSGHCWLDKNSCVFLNWFFQRRISSQQISVFSMIFVFTFKKFFQISYVFKKTTFCFFLPAFGSFFLVFDIFKNMPLHNLYQNCNRILRKILFVFLVFCIILNFFLRILGRHFLFLAVLRYSFQENFASIKLISYHL